MAKNASTTRNHLNFVGFRLSATGKVCMVVSSHQTSRSFVCITLISAKNIQVRQYIFMRKSITPGYAQVTATDLEKPYDPAYAQLPSGRIALRGSPLPDLDGGRTELAYLPAGGNQTVESS